MPLYICVCCTVCGVVGTILLFLRVAFKWNEWFVVWAQTDDFMPTSCNELRCIIFFYLAFTIFINYAKNACFSDRKRRTACYVASAPSGGYPSPSQWVPQSQLGGTPVPTRGYPSDLGKNLDWSTSWKGTGARDLGKNLGLRYLPWKGPGTRDLGKNLGLGYPPPPTSWMDKQSKSITFPCSSKNIQKSLVSCDLFHVISVDTQISRGGHNTLTLKYSWDILCSGQMKCSGQMNLISQNSYWKISPQSLNMKHCVFVGGAMFWSRSISN